MSRDFPSLSSTRCFSFGALNCPDDGGAAGCVKCSDLVHRLLLYRLVLVLSRLALVLSGLSLSCLMSGLADACVHSRRSGEGGRRERHDKAKGQCRYKGLHLRSSVCLGCSVAPVRGNASGDPIGGVTNSPEGATGCRSLPLAQPIARRAFASLPGFNNFDRQL